MQPTQYLNASLTGLLAFGVFFITLFNGMGYIIVMAGIVGLFLNTAISGYMALESIAKGFFTATAYSAPIAVFSALAVGDLVVKGNSGPFVFWFSGALATFAAGALGVLAICLYRLMVPKR